MFNSDNLTVNEQGRLCIGSHDTVELAKEFGTPLYVLDEDKVRQSCRGYKNAIDEYYGGMGLALYASKALCTMYTARVAAEEELEAGRKAARMVGGGSVNQLPVTLPAQPEWQHCLLVCEKKVKTVRQYPRKAGTPSRSPLGASAAKE